jgi:hypothetical protein
MYGFASAFANALDSLYLFSRLYPAEAQQASVQTTAAAAEGVTGNGDDEGGDDAVDLSRLESSLSRTLENVQTVAHRDETKATSGRLYGP